MNDSVLMLKIFSDTADGNFTKIISGKINEARINGIATYSDAEFDLVFADVDGDVVIEDKKNNEITEATVDPKTGEAKLECKAQSATEPDVVVPRVKGEDGNGVEAPNSTLPNVDSPITVGIVDSDKAGQGKHFSVVYDGFTSEEEAREFSESIAELANMDDEVFTFSSEELAEVVSCMSDAEELLDKVVRYSYQDDANELSDVAQSLYSYALMAEQMGHDTDDMQERCLLYSDVADEATYNNEMSMSVTEVFSNMEEDEITEFFSTVDEDVADVIYSALEIEANSDEVVTFSDVNEAVRINDEMSQDITTMFSDCTEDDVVEFFSNIDQGAAVVISNILDSGESVTFSEVNEELQLLDEPLTSVFSEYSEEDMTEYLAQFSEGELNLIEQIFSQAEEDETYTYSDYLQELDQYQTQQLMFSDEELSEVVNNANELEKASKDLQKSPKDAELAKKVKLLADDTLQKAEVAEEAGHNVDVVKKMCAQYSEQSAKILDDKGVVVPSEPGKVLTDVTKDSKRETVPEAVEESGKCPTTTGEKTNTFSSCLTEPKAGFNGQTPNKLPNSKVEDDVKVFSKTTDKTTSSVNPCLNFKF